MDFVSFIIHTAQQQQLIPFDRRVIAASNQGRGFGKEEEHPFFPEYEVSQAGT